MMHLMTRSQLNTLAISQGTLIVDASVPQFNQSFNELLDTILKPFKYSIQAKDLSLTLNSSINDSSCLK